MMTNRQRIKRRKKRDRARARAASAQSHGLKILSALDKHLDDLFTRKDVHK